MIIMESFTHRSNRYREIFYRRDIFIIWFIAIHVSNTVHEKGDVQRCAEAADEASPK